MLTSSPEPTTTISDAGSDFSRLVVVFIFLWSTYSGIRSIKTAQQIVEVQISRMSSIISKRRLPKKRNWKWKVMVASPCCELADDYVKWTDIFVFKIWRFEWFGQLFNKRCNSVWFKEMTGGACSTNYVRGQGLTSGESTQAKVKRQGELWCLVRKIDASWEAGGGKVRCKL